MQIFKVFVSAIFLSAALFAAENGKTVEMTGSGKYIYSVGDKSYTYTMKSFAVTPMELESGYWIFTAIFFHDTKTDKDYAFNVGFQPISKPEKAFMIGATHGDKTYLIAGGLNNDGVYGRWTVNKVDDIYSLEFEITEDVAIYRDGDADKPSTMAIKKGTKVTFTAKK